MAKAAAIRERTEREVTFEIYVRQRNRWIIYEVLPERKSAIDLAHELASGRENRAVRVVRDDLDVRTGHSKTLVILDTEVHVPKPPEPPQQPPPEPRRPPRPEPEIRRRTVAPARTRPPWLAVGATGLALAALGAWLLA